MKRLGVLVLVFFCFGMVSSAPSISGVAGSLDYGERVSVAGSDFGSMGGKIISWDDFEAHDLNSIIYGSSPIIGPIWTTIYSYKGLGARYDSGHTHSGRVAAHIDWGYSPSNTIRAFGWAGQEPFSQVYISYWRYMTGEYCDACNHKQFFLYGNNNQMPQGLAFIPGDNTRWGFYNNEGDGDVPYPVRNNLNTAGWTYDNTKNKFQRWEWWVVLDEVPKTFTGTIKVWLDGELGIENYNDGTRYVDGEFIDFRLGHMAQGMTGSAKAWFDDLYIATTQARVELCDSSSWNSRIHCEVQAPLSWSDSGVSFDFNPGSFSSGQSAYLFVIDSDGVASGGYLVNIGEGLEIDCDGDSDGDYYGSGSGCLGVDCDDSDSSVHDEVSCIDYSDCSSYDVCGACESVPSEVCNEVDDDCDGSVDEGCSQDGGDGDVVDVSEIIVDNSDSSTSQTGTWGSSSYYSGYEGSNYLYSSNSAGDTFTWSADLESAGNYSVYAKWTSVSGRPTEVVYSVGGEEVIVNQEEDGGTWVLLGSYEFDVGDVEVVLTSSESSEGTCADAIRFVLESGGNVGVKGDSNGDGVISLVEVEGYVEIWLEGEVSIGDLLEVVNGWKEL